MEESDKQSHTDKAKKDKKKTRNGVREKLFKCTGYEDCNMVFSRAEHLARHMRKHTGEKPFQCHICFKYFSRPDNLKQHKENVHSKIENIASILKSQSRIYNGQFNGMNSIGANNTYYVNSPYYQYPYHSNGLYYNYVGTNDNIAIPSNNVTQPFNSYTPGYFNGYHSFFPIDMPGANMNSPAQSYMTTNTTTLTDAALHNNIPSSSGIVNSNCQSNEGIKIGNNIPKVNHSSNSTHLTDNSRIGIISKSNGRQQNSNLLSTDTARSMNSVPLLKNNVLEKEQSPAPSVLSTDSSSLGHNIIPGEKLKNNPYNFYPTMVDGQLVPQQNGVATANNTTTNYSFYPYNMISNNLPGNHNWVNSSSQASAVGSTNSTPTTTTSTGHDNNTNYVSNMAPFNNSLPYQAILQQPKTITALPVQLEREGIVSVPSIYQEINSKMKMNEQHINENNRNINKSQFTNAPYYLLSSSQTMPYQTRHPQYQAQSTVSYDPIQPSADLLNINHKNSAINNVFSNLTINNKSNNLNTDKNKIYDTKPTFTKNSTTDSSTPSLDSKSTVASESSSSIVSSATSSTIGREYKNNIDGGNVNLSYVRDDILKNNSHKRKLPDASSSSSSGNSSNNNSSGSSNYSGSSSDISSDVNESNIQDIENTIHEDGDEKTPKNEDCFKKSSAISKKNKKKNDGKSKSKSDKSKSKSSSKPHKKRSKKKSNDETDLRESIVSGSFDSPETSESVGEAYDTTVAKTTENKERQHEKTKEKGKESNFNDRGNNNNNNNNNDNKKKTKDAKEDQIINGEASASTTTTTTSRLSLDYIIS